MKKSTIFIIAVAFICLVSASYGILNNTTNTTDSNTNQNTIIKNTTDTILENINNASNSAIISYDDAAYDDIEVDSPIESESNKSWLSWFVPVKGEHGWFINGSQNFTDIYWQCVECGRFTPLGEVTKELPKIALCTQHNHGNTYMNINDTEYYFRTYDEAIKMWSGSSWEVYYSNPDNLDIHDYTYEEYFAWVDAQPINPWDDAYRISINMSMEEYIITHNLNVQKDNPVPEEPVQTVPSYDTEIDGDFRSTFSGNNASSF